MKNIMTEQKRIERWCEVQTHLLHQLKIQERKGNTERADAVKAEMEGMRNALWILTFHIPENDGNDKIHAVKP